MRKAAPPRSAPPIRLPKVPTPPELVPRVIAPASLDDHLEIMTRAIFQAGLSWALIAARWGTFRTAFEQFSVPRVAGYGDIELERLMSTDKLIHSEKKFVGTFANARTLLELERDYGSIEAYLAGFASYPDVFAAVHARFAFMGDLNCYYWLLRSANPVPQFEDWIGRQERDHPRMREMVVLARSNGTSSERSGF